MKKLAKLTDVPIDKFLELAAEPALVVHFPGRTDTLRCPIYTGESFEDTLERMRRLIKNQGPSDGKPSEAFLLGFHKRTLYKLPIPLATLLPETEAVVEVASR